MAGVPPGAGVVRMGSAGERGVISDVTTWVACRTLLDHMGIGDVRMVDAPVPRGENH